MKGKTLEMAANAFANAYAQVSEIIIPQSTSWKTNDGRHITQL